MASEPPDGGRGFGTFLVVWIGQLVSVLGSTLTGFAMGIWVFIETGSVTTFAFIIVSASVPGLLVSPLAGSVVDRFDRRLVMLGADLSAGQIRSRFDGSVVYMGPEKDLGRKHAFP